MCVWWELLSNLALIVTKKVGTILMVRTKLIILYYHPRSHRDTRLTETVGLLCSRTFPGPFLKRWHTDAFAQRVNVDEKQTNMSINRCFPWKRDFICYQLI